MTTKAKAKLRKAKYVKQVTCTMISLVDRSQSRAESVAQLKAAGFAVNVIESDPLEHARDHGNHFSNAMAAVEAIELALENKTGILFTEDDIEIGRHFGAMFDMAVIGGKVTYFYAHDKTDRLNSLYDPTTKVNIKSRQTLEPRIQEFVKTSWLPFTQCVYIPKDILAEFDLTELKKGAKSFDLWLMAYLTHKQIPAFVALPHPVQHKINREGRSGEDSAHSYKRSLSYQG